MKQMQFLSPNHDERRWISKELAKFPFVQWDRFYRNTKRDEDRIVVFGWIEREQDAYKDFVVLEFDLLETKVWVNATSSAKYSEEICEKMGAYAHNPCQRCEFYFRNPNCIRTALHPAKDEKVKE